MEAEDSLPELFLLRAVTDDRESPKPEGTEDAYQHALTLDANDADAHVQYALHLRAAKRFPEAFEQARKALELDPASPSTNVIAGWVFLSGGEEHEATTMLQKALTLKAEYPSALYFLARISEQHERTGEAAAYLERATTSSGRTPKYLRALGMVYAESGKNNQARKLLNELRQQAKHEYVDPDYMASLAAKVAGPAN